MGWLQTQRLRKEFDVNFEWLGYELWPDELEWPEPGPPPVPSKRPPLLSRFEFLLVADGAELPGVERPKRMRTHNAHEAVEYAKTQNIADEMVEALYRALWEHGKEINKPAVIAEVASPIVSDLDQLRKAIEERRFREKIVGFDIPAYETGVYNVPTFFIGGKLYAEQPYANLKKAIRSL